MVKSYCAWLMFCLVTVHALPTPETPVPHSQVGPFDAVDEYFSPPLVLNSSIKGVPIFEGDIRNPGLAAGGAGSLKPWPNAIIPYRFDCSVENIPSAMKAVHDAMHEWQSRTCIKFVKKRPEDVAFLEFFRSAGCWATYVGYKLAKTQISIGKGCAYKHVMVHELGHVIGFWHEQSRKDRDDYIGINWGNIIQSLKYNFDKVKERTSNYGQAYDFGSIMHYPWNAFSTRSDLKTIYPIKRTTKTPYVRLSDVDVKQTKEMYKCNDIISRGIQARALQARGIQARGIQERTIQERAIQALSRGIREISVLRNAPQQDEYSSCKETNQYCKDWAEDGHCITNSPIVPRTCPISCNVERCRCIDDLPECPEWAKSNYCNIGNPEYVRKHCQKSCKECQVEQRTCCEGGNKVTEATKPSPTKSTTKVAVQETTKAVPGAIITTLKKKYTGVRCSDTSSKCKGWAQEGRCVTDRWVKSNCLESCERHDVCDLVPPKPEGACASAFGISAFTNKVYGFIASSIFYPGGGWSAPPQAGRLYLGDDHTNKVIGAWCADPSRTDSNEYLAIGFGERKRVTAVATQGRDQYFEHVKTYTLAFSDNGANFQDYKENGETKVFDGNCDHMTPVINVLKSPIIASFIRFTPVTFIGAKCLRVEVYGC